MDRLNRIGQTKPVRVVIIASFHTIKNPILEIQEAKQVLGKVGALRKVLWGNFGLDSATQFSGVKHGHDVIHHQKTGFDSHRWHIAMPSSSRDKAHDGVPVWQPSMKVGKSGGSAKNKIRIKTNIL